MIRITISVGVGAILCFYDGKSTHVMEQEFRVGTLFPRCLEPERQLERFPRSIDMIYHKLPIRTSSRSCNDER